MWYFFRILSSLTSILLIVLTIPIAFDVGGKDAGLAFSLSAAIFYFLLSVISLITPPGSRFRAAAHLFLNKTSWVTISALLLWSLAKFSVDAPSTNWVEKTFTGRQPSQNASLWEWIMGRHGFVESTVLGGWDKLLRWSIPVFQVGEGFCSLLVIQACGQLTRWVVSGENGDSWMIGLMSVSAAIISSSSYFLYRIFSFPEIGNVDAILIGFSLACAIILGVYGISSSRGNVVESSLLFAYITLCIYQIFTDYQSSSPPRHLETSSQPALPPLPPIIMASYSTFVHFASILPSYVFTVFNFVEAAFMTITPSVLISLAYRTVVMILAARIIPAIRDSGARALHHPPSLDDSDDANRFLALLGVGWWASQGANAGGNLWRWVNLAFTMLIYTIELYLGRGDGENGLSHHWHQD